MFGFLRRKKPAPGDVPPGGDTEVPASPAQSAADPAAAPPAAQAGGLQALDPGEPPASAPPTQAAPADAADPVESDARGTDAPSASTASPSGGIASRLSALWPFRRGGQPAETPPPAGPGPDDEDLSDDPTTARGTPVEPAVLDTTARAPHPGERTLPTDEAPTLPVRADLTSAETLPAERFEAGSTPAAGDEAALDAAETEVEPFVSEPPPERAGWMARLKQGLSKTRSNLGTLFVGVKVDEALFEELESALLVADAGMDATTHLLDRLREVVKKERLNEGEQVKRALKDLAAQMLEPLEQPMDIDRAEPLVMMIAGVNGAGKTTSIGKLARHLQRERKSVLLAAGDTFRAAAREQLAQWGERNNVAVIAQAGGDPAAVAFDAVSAARARRVEVVIVDTAGRLPTQLHLMDELKKVRRVVAKAMEGAPHETLLVLDGNTGQNALAQVKAFDDAVPLSGLVVTKLDGTAKGGALIALAHSRRDRPIPVYFIGVGEGIDDLQAFSAREFADALFD